MGIKRLVLALTAYSIAALFVLPYLQMILTAVRPPDELAVPELLPSRVDWSNFTGIFADGLGVNLGVSLRVASVSTILVLLVAIPAAYYTARHQYRGRQAFLLIVLATQMFQPTAMLVGIYQQYTAWHLVNTIWALILVNAGFNLAFSTWILTAYIASIPAELEEAAKVDGASRVRTLFSITLPLAWPGIVTALIFTFIASWNEFIVGLLLTTNPENQPVTVALDAYIGTYEIAWGRLFAASAVATIPVIILFAFIEGKVVGGLTAGAVK